MRRLAAIAAFVAMALWATAGNNTSTAVERPVTSSYTIGLGSCHLRDTYLTPIKYTGWSVALDYERFQAMRFDPEHWVMQLHGNLSLAKGKNPSHSASMWTIDFTPSWSMMRRFDIGSCPGLRLLVGGTAGADIGAMYLARNSNNPVTVKAAITIGATAMATYSFTLGRLPVTLRYQPTLPLIGAFFAPDYDELYYEIWLGNHKGLCRVAWPGSYINLENIVTADLRLGATALRVGYRNRVFSTKAAGIVSRRIDHSFVIGVTTEWLSLAPGHKNLRDTKIISAFY